VTLGGGCYDGVTADLAANVTSPPLVCYDYHFGTIGGVKEDYCDYDQQTKTTCGAGVTQYWSKKTLLRKRSYEIQGGCCTATGCIVGTDGCTGSFCNHGTLWDTPGEFYDGLGGGLHLHRPDH
jgi:hypothetical protein